MNILRCALVALVLMVALTAHSRAQGSSSAERKAFREYTSPQELVSISATTPLDQALAIISEVCKRFTGKIVIDTQHRTMPAGLDIKGMQWRDALEALCRKNSLAYNEFDTYIQITDQPSGPGGNAAVLNPQVGPNGHEQPTAKSREVKISAYFLEANLSRLEEVGLNWTFMKSTQDVNVSAGFSGADNVSTKMFDVSAATTPHVSFGNIQALARLFSNYQLGEILSGPQVIVRSGEEGRIQVGQDFSVRERDFAGNLIDKFYSAGTIIKVAPQVINDQGLSFVHLTTEVERSDVSPGTLTTIVNRTKANTDLLLLDGEETIIGGLYTNTTNTIRSGVPFLKDLPWYVLGLRYIFGYNKDEVAKRELVILLKAEIVPTLQERVNMKRKEDGIFNRWKREQERMEQHISPDAQ